MHSGLCEQCVKSLGLRPSGCDFLFRTRPRALWQQTPPEPVLITKHKLPICSRILNLSKRVYPVSHGNSWIATTEGPKILNTQHTSPQVVFEIYAFETIATPPREERVHGDWVYWWFVSCTTSTQHHSRFSINWRYCIFLTQL